jgi:DNA-binding LacI/PurR family transcriptional regulator
MPKRDSRRRSNPSKPPAGKQRRVLLMLAWYRVEMHRAVAQFAREHDWRLDDISATCQLIPHGWRGDGVLVKLSGDPKHPVDAFVRRLRVPVVDLGFFGHTIGAPSLRIDNDRVGVLAVEHLWARGIRRFVWYPSISAGAALERERSVRAEVQRLGGHAWAATSRRSPPPPSPPHTCATRCHWGASWRGCVTRSA